MKLIKGLLFLMIILATQSQTALTKTIKNDVLELGPLDQSCYPPPTPEQVTLTTPGGTLELSDQINLTQGGKDYALRTFSMQLETNHIDKRFPDEIISGEPEGAYELELATGHTFKELDSKERLKLPLSVTKGSEGNLELVFTVKCIIFKGQLTCPKLLFLNLIYKGHSSSVALSPAANKWIFFVPFQNSSIKIGISQF